MGTVYVVQDNTKLNMLPAERFGRLEVILEEGRQVMLNAASTVRRIRTALHSYRDGDYILAIGDPVAIGIACAAAAMQNEGRFTVLKWDRHESRYYAVAVDMTRVLL